MLNILHFTQENSVITIEAKIKDGDESVSNYSSALNLRKKSNHIEHSLIVHIIDPSWSISNEERISLFKPITVSQISEKSGPSQINGKSLYIARLITQKIGGDILVDSTTRGSVISVEMKLDSSQKRVPSADIEVCNIELQMPPIDKMNVPKGDTCLPLSGELDTNVGLSSPDFDHKKDQIHLNLPKDRPRLEED